MQTQLRTIVNIGIDIKKRHKPFQRAKCQLDMEYLKWVLLGIFERKWHSVMLTCSATFLKLEIKIVLLKSEM